MKRLSSAKPLAGAMAAIVLLSSCTTMPTGPSVMVLPGSGKNFDQFRVDDYDCRSYAQAQSGGVTASSAADESVARSALLGTVIGAAAGAAIGGRGSVGVGAGTGLAIGGLSGTGAAQASGYTLQQRYDIGYQQCMYAKGNQIPSYGGRARQVTRYPAVTSYPSAPPPPPEGMPPPPPAR
ncbi:MAG: hypothetical protein ACRYGK_03155 [Janthinobacterium lividum]